MKIHALSDNALFIRNWKERMRPHLAGSAACIVLLITLLIFMGNYFNRDSLYSYEYTMQKSPFDHYVYAEEIHRHPESKSFPIPWLNNALFQLAVLQGVILFLFGTFSAGKMAGLEKSSGTLDFHRCTPVPRIDQIIGLVFGAPALEWCLFFGTLAVSLFVVLFARVDIARALFFYISLILSALFFHSLVVFSALYSNSKRYRTGSVLIALYLYGYLAFMLSCLYHATPFPAYGDLYNMLIQLNRPASMWDSNHSRLMHSFFGYTMPYFLLQTIVQVPLLMLFLLGIKRKFEYGERPVWSKAQSASLIYLVLFYFTGSVISQNSAAADYFPQQVQIIAFWCIVFLCMLLVAPSATPTHLAFIKGLHRARKTGVGRLSPEADQSSNWLWLTAFCFIAAAAFAVVAAFYWHIAPYTLGVVLITGLCYIIFFCGILEYFYLSRFHQKKAILVAGLLILWGVVPAFGFITKTIVSSPRYLQYFVAPSPFFGMGFLTGIIEKNQSSNFAVIQPCVFMVIAALLAASALLLARRERVKLVKATLSKVAP